MKLKKETNKITQAAVIASIAIVLTLVFMYSFPILLVLFPTIFIVLGVKTDIKHCILSLITTSLIIGFFTDVFTALSMFIQFGILSIVIVYMMNKKFKPIEIIIGGTIVFLLSTSIIITGIGYISGVGFVDQVEMILKEASEIQMQLLPKMNMTDITTNQLENIIKTMTEFTVLIIPVMIVAFSLICTYINYWASLAILKRLGFMNITIPKFHKFRLPDNVIFGTLIIFLLSLAIRYLEIFYYDTIFLNVIILIALFYFIQGLAVIMYFLNKLKVNKFLRVIVLIIVLINMSINAFIALLGFLDALFDFRKIKREAKL